MMTNIYGVCTEHAAPHKGYSDFVQQTGPVISGQQHQDAKSHFGSNSLMELNSVTEPELANSLIYPRPSLWIIGMESKRRLSLEAPTKSAGSSMLGMRKISHTLNHQKAFEVARQKEAFPLAGRLSQLGTRYAWNLSKPDTRSRVAGGAILTIPKALSAAGHYPVLDNTVMHCFLHAAAFAHRVCKAVAIGFLESTKKGSISNATPESMGQSAKSHFGHVNLFGDTYLYRAQPFGSMPKRSSSLRPNVLSQLAKLIPASEAATSNCAFSSGVIRTGKTGALPSDECLLSRFAIDMYIPTGLVFYLVGIYLITVNAEKETPPNGITSTSRGLTNNVMETNAMAKPQCNQTHPKFQYRFLAISRSDRNAKPCRMSVEAHTEREARQVLAPHFILSLAARLPMQGMEEITIPSTIEQTSTVQEVSHA